MDPYEDLQNTACEVAKALAGKTAPTTYTADNGQTIQGWSVESSSYSNDQVFSRQSFVERWGTHRLILATDGQLYEYLHDQEERETGKTERKSIYPKDQRELVGSKGKPFSEIKAKLERLPWTV